MKKRLLAAIMSLCMIVSLLPVSALAADNSGMEFSKAVTSNEDGTYTLTLEAWATGEEVRIPGTSTPLDIVLVLDQSGSMAYDFDRGTRQEAMKAAVTNFVDQVADNARDNNVTHQIGIVTFGTNARTLVELQDAEKNSDSIKWRVNELARSPSGATQVDRGMDEAADMLADARQDSKKVVIVFTDGIPTSGNIFDTEVATDAIQTAKNLKDNGVSIYTVGIFGGADPTETYGDLFDTGLPFDVGNVECNGNVGEYWGGTFLADWFTQNDFDASEVTAGNRFLNFLSSNYAEADQIGITRDEGFLDIYIAYTITKNFEETGSGYYLTADSADGLTDAFEKIEDSIGSQPVNGQLNESTQIVDEISDYFQLAGDVEADAVKVSTVDYDGRGWDESTKRDITSTVTVDTSSNTVKVSGYDFAANYVSGREHDGGYGQKLVIEITVAPVENPDACGTAQIPTNGDAAVVLEGTTIETAETPTVTGVELDYANNDELVGGVSDLPEGGYYVQGVDATVSGEVPVTTTENVVFAGWSTEIPDELLDENDKDIASGLLNGSDTIAMDGEKTLYAVWAKDSDGDGTPDYDEEEELTPDGSSVKVSKVPVTASTLLLTTLNNEKVSLTSGKDYIQATGNATDGYQVYTTGDSATVMWSVTIDSTKPGFITVSDDGATYKGATFGNRAGAKVEANASGDGYVVTFDEMTSSEDAGLAVLYFSREITGLTEGESRTIENVAVVGGEDVSSDDVTIIQGQTYSVEYEWAGTNKPAGVNPPTDDNQYAAGSTVTVSNEHWVGQTIESTSQNLKYIFYGWEVKSPKDVTIKPDNTFTMPAEDVTIAGTWERQRNGAGKNYITVQVVNGTATCGDFTTSDISHFEAAEGQDYTITFTPDKGYMLGDVIVDGEPKTLTADGEYTFNDVNEDHGIVVYFEVDESYEPTPELTFADVNSHKFPETAPSVELKQLDGSTKTLTEGVNYSNTYRGEGADPYYVTTTEDTATVLYRVSVSIRDEQPAGYITVSDQNPDAVYMGAKLNYADVTVNPEGGYIVTFDELEAGESNRYAILYFTIEVENLVKGEPQIVENTAVIGGEELEGDPATVTRTGGTYRVYYEWSSSGAPYGVNAPVDQTLYEEGQSVTVSDKYYVGETRTVGNYKYAFWGWSAKEPADLIIGADNTFAMPAQDVTLEGKWQSVTPQDGKNHITVKVVNGSAVFDEQDYYHVEDGVKTFQVTQGNDYAITFTPTPGYTLGTVMVDGKWVEDPQLTNGTYSHPFDDIDADHGIVVYFVKDTNEYTLTYDGNGKDVTNVPDSETGLKAGPHDLSTTVPVREGYGFIGWSTTQDSTIYKAGQKLPTVVTSVNMQKDTTVYAVWGADTNGDKVADAQQVLITPAPITIYQGGDGYESVVQNPDDASEVPGEASVSSTGLPEPGYYIVLPWQVNENLKALATEAGDVKDGIVNLSKYLTFTYDVEGVQRTWELELYDKTGESRTSTGYIYRILPAKADTDGDGVEEEIPIRLVFIDENNQETISDNFEFNANDLYAEFKMTIYDGGLQQNKVQATVQGTEKAQDVGVGTSTLTIRGNNTETTTAIVPNTPDNVETITAQATNVTYYINDSTLKVKNENAVKLLADELVATPDALKKAANTAIGNALTASQYDFMYLDLVDTSNGNAYVTLNQNNEDHSVTIHWPMPANADPDTIHVVHFDGLDREFAIDELGELLTTTVKIVTYDKEDGLTVDEESGSVSFDTSTFSPFVLVYEEKDTSTDPGTDPNPGHGGSGGGNYTDNDDSDPTGNLSIELDVNGGDDSFTFTVYLTDKDGDDLKNNFYFNGDFTGTIGSGDEITLESGETIIIRNLPEGTRYEVVIETADGYTYVIDGEEGIIHTGMNEADFTATRTVPVADPSVTGVSRWLNVTDHIAYLTGYPTGGFGPDNSMTRAEVAQMFYALLNNKNVTITKTFPDVPSGAWYATAVNTLASLGMVSGDENGNYRPDAPITRAEFCAIALAFAYEPENAVCYFTDVARGDWFYPYVAQAASYGWIGGYTDGSFGPNQQITRAQVTTIVNNMLGRVADRDYVIDHQNTLVQFNDLTRAHWAYFQIMEATNAHDYTKANGEENWR